MHRLMMNSQAYRQSSHITDELQQLDPQNRLLSRMTLRRLSAEAIRDSLLFVSQRLDETIGGPPDPVTVDFDGLVSVVPTPDGRWRRSVYVRHRRTQIPSMMETFDYPQMGPNCLVRNVSTVSPQSLMLMNNGQVRELAASFAARVLGETKGKPFETQVDTVYQLALSRLPNEAERKLGVESLEQLQSHWQGEPSKAMESYCHTILNSAAFIYID